MARALSASQKFSWWIRCLAWCVVLLLAAVSTLNLWPQWVAAFVPLRPGGLAGHSTLPQARCYLGLDSYQKHNMEDAAAWMRLFNECRPTQDSLLLEGKCDLELGRLDAARILYRNVIAFDPRSRRARLALIDLDLKEIAGSSAPLAARIDEILNMVPWDDAESIAKISDRLLTLSESRPGKPRFLLTAAVLYLDPADLVLLRKAGMQVLKEPESRGRVIGARLIISTLLAEKGRLSEGDIARLEAFYPGGLTEPEKNALLAGRFLRISAEAMIAQGSIPDNRSKISFGTDPYPICLERDWLRNQGWKLRRLHEQR